MFGGSFDPLHKGHLHATQKAQEQCEKLFIVLSYSRRRDRIPFELRYRWLRDSLNDMNIAATVIALEDDSETKESTWAEWEAGRNTVLEKIGSPVDVVFAGSDYRGSNIYERLYKCPVVYIDRNEMNGISSTAISEDPLITGWDSMAPRFHQWYRKRVLIAGAESTGKTTLTKLLASHYSSQCQLEFGREVCEACHGESMMLPSDYIRILHGHASSELHLAENMAGKVLFTDTDALATLWFARLAHFPQREQDSIEALAWATVKANRYDLILFLEPTVPFVQDGWRNECSQQERMANSARLKQMYIDGYGSRCPIVTVNETSFEERTLKAISLVDALMRK